MGVFALDTFFESIFIAEPELSRGRHRVELLESQQRIYLHQTRVYVRRYCIKQGRVCARYIVSSLYSLPTMAVAGAARQSSC